MLVNVRLGLLLMDGVNPFKINNSSVVDRFK